jgi:hypothetical protein
LAFFFLLPLCFPAKTASLTNFPIQQQEVFSARGGLATRRAVPEDLGREGEVPDPAAYSAAQKQEWMKVLASLPAERSGKKAKKYGFLE